MNYKLITHNSLNHKIVLLCIFTIATLIARILLTKSTFYSFLVWNLFLAAIPYVITQFLVLNSSFQKSKLKFWIGFCVWLLFLPNSPYIITDLVHLHNSKSVLLWGDLFLVFSFAFAGLLFGLSSMLEMFNLLKFKLAKKQLQLLMLMVCFACGFGIYMGRFLRFNSWDILTQPFHLLKATVLSINSTAIIITVAFGSFLWIVFVTLKSFIIGSKLQKKY